jgi:hypothetical protein
MLINVLMNHPACRRVSENFPSLDGRGWMKGRVNHPHLNPPPSRGRMDKETLWQATGNSQVKVREDLN